MTYVWVTVILIQYINVAYFRGKRLNIDHANYTEIS